jgi:hypothetical protein
MEQLDGLSNRSDSPSRVRAPPNHSRFYFRWRGLVRGVEDDTMNFLADVVCGAAVLFFVGMGILLLGALVGKFCEVGRGKE